ncbi:hypothetical protein C491_09404 [Natronococcus amylolyticus DSM 10524]|uniref:Lipoprotein n=1 Tax=Natronococcus amylolyticus DSM 10524 TaxID=1227497 RepID=L9X8H0_9EURY|nr:hypothetical protein [Natronococcus amylolyticus]ELY58000.1 hypothetical protein C491_09404 [Natronococcus amylolyticus DSM 10524]
MNRHSRRGLLTGTAGAIALLAGCIGDDPSGADGGTNDDGPTDDETSTDDEESDDSADDSENEDTEADDSAETDDEDEDKGGNGDESPSIEDAPFTTTEPRSEPAATLLADREDADAWLEDRNVGEEAETFLEETMFDEASLVALEARGPNLCYELALEAATLEAGAIRLEAVADDGDDADSCAQQEVTVGRLVRISDGGDPVDEGSATIADRSGDAHEFELGADE